MKTKPLRYVLLMMLMTLLSYAAFGQATVTLVWGPSPDAFSYKIYAGTNSGAYDQITTSAGTNTSFTVSNLTDGQTYYFVASAINAYGEESPFSNEATYTTHTTPSDILAPSILSVQATNGIEFYWPAPTNFVPDGYKLTHWSAGVSIIDEQSDGLKTNVTYRGMLAAGANYFAVSSYKLVNGELLMSGFSNVAVMTNTPAIIYEPVLFGGTNLLGTWSRVETNRLVIFPTKDCEFFKGGVRMTRTNIVTLQAP